MTRTITAIAAVLIAATLNAGVAHADPTTTDEVCAAFKLGLSPDEIAQRLGQYDANYWQAQRATVWPIIEGDCD